MNKVTIVINGRGGVGKDTLCNLAAKHFKVKNISTITPIKDLAREAGWDGRKDDRSRKFLADLKELCATYNDYPTNWAKAQYESFLESEDEILFVHIREPHEIVKYVNATGGKAKTLLVRGGARMRKSVYGNAADDGVDNYYYDYYFDNDKGFKEAEEGFTELMRRVLEEEDVAK